MSDNLARIRMLAAAKHLTREQKQRLLPDDLTPAEAIEARRAGLIDAHRLCAAIPADIRARIGLHRPPRERNSHG